jgi:hypothetical protein
LHLTWQFKNKTSDLNILPSQFHERENYEDVEEVFYLLQSTPIRSKKSFDSLRSDVSGISKKCGQFVREEFDVNIYRINQL